MMNGTWQLRPLWEVATQFQYGLSVRGESSGRYPILRMNCQDDGDVVLRDLQFVDLAAAEASSYLLRRGDILFNRTNSHDLVGRTAIFDHDAKAVFASYLIRISVDRSRLDPQFLNQFLNWDNTQTELRKLASRGVSQSNISAGKLRDFAVPIPSLDEQRRIASALSAVRNAVRVHQRGCNSALVLKRAAMREVFTRGLRGEAQKESEAAHFLRS
jgi:type I restriction enzyme, S subunit